MIEFQPIIRDFYAILFPFLYTKSHLKRVYSKNDFTSIRNAMLIFLLVMYVWIIRTKYCLTKVGIYCSKEWIYSQIPIRVEPFFQTEGKVILTALPALKAYQFLLTHWRLETPNG